MYVTCRLLVLTDRYVTVELKGILIFGFHLVVTSFHMVTFSYNHNLMDTFLDSSLQIA